MVYLGDSLVHELKKPNKFSTEKKEFEVNQGTSKVADITVITGIGGILFGANIGLGTIGSLVLGIVAAALVVMTNRKSR